MSRRGPLDRRSFWASASAHAVVLVFLLWVAPALRQEAVAYEVVRVSFASPPPTPADEEVLPAPEDELVIETPQPEPEPAPPEEDPVPEPALPEPSPPEPEEEAAPEPPPEPDPAPPVAPPEEESPPPAPPDTPPAEEPRDAQAAPTEDAENAEDDGRDVAARMEGLRRDYPEYYANIIVQMERCFRGRSRGSRLEVVVTFKIARDGSTSEIDVERSSGSFAFDLDAQGAAECAGKAGRLGPLPEDYPWAFLPVQFTFSPRTRGP